MIRHFFIDKSNTIYKNSPTKNVGLNPICELTYGGNNYISRVLLHFDENEILDLINDKTFSDINALTVYLKMTNCFSVDGYPYEKLLINGLEKRQRACSFDIIAVELPQQFDGGRGFDYVSDFWIENKRSISYEGSSWNFSETGKVWPIDEDKLSVGDKTVYFEDKKIFYYDNCDKVNIKLEGGVYSNDFIKNQLQLFENGEPSVVIGVQHFDFGDENLNIDITNYVKKIIDGEKNNGILLMFSPRIEEIQTSIPQYVGFFNDHTNTFFHPYIEVINDKYIMDNRANFCVKKENKIYFYCNVDGTQENLDEMPICTINDESYNVTQEGKGIYSVKVPPLSEDMAGSILYDTWSNIIYNGERFEDIENEFEVHSSRNFISIGKDVSTKQTFVPTVYGINENEDLNQNEVRELTVDFRYIYETFKMRTINFGEYRIYVKDGNREVTVFDYQPIEHAFLKNFFVVNTKDMIPNKYYIDIRVKNGRDERYYKNILSFNVVSNVTERYE